MLEVRSLGRTGAFTEVSFSLRKGEILGLTGLVGSGAKDLLTCLFGLAAADAGTERGVQLGMTFLNGTSIRAHHKAAGAARKPTLQHSETIVRHLAGLVAAMGPPCGASVSSAA